MTEYSQSSLGGNKAHFPLTMPSLRSKLSPSGCPQLPVTHCLHVARCLDLSGVVLTILKTTSSYESDDPLIENGAFHIQSHFSKIYEPHLNPTLSPVKRIHSRFHSLTLTGHLCNSSSVMGCFPSKPALAQDDNLRALCHCLRYSHVLNVIKRSCFLQY